MADDRHTFYAQQRCPAVFSVIQTFLEIVECRSGQHCTNLTGNRRLQRFFQNVLDHFNQAFADFQGHIANEAIAHNDVGKA